MKEDTILKVLPWDIRSIIQKEKLEFEKAVFYRDRLGLLREVQSQQAIYKLKGEADN